MQWYYDPSSKTIMNSQTRMYAYPENSQLAAGTRVLLGPNKYAWEVNALSKGKFT